MLSFPQMCFCLQLMSTDVGGSAHLYLFIYAKLFVGMCFCLNINIYLFTYSNWCQHNHVLSFHYKFIVLETPWQRTLNEFFLPHPPSKTSVTFVTSVQEHARKMMPSATVSKHYLSWNPTPPLDAHRNIH